MKKKKKTFKPESVARDLPVKAEGSVSCPDPRAARLPPQLDSNAGKKKKPQKKPRRGKQTHIPHTNIGKGPADPARIIARCAFPPTNLYLTLQARQISDDTNHVEVRWAAGISARFDRSNDIVSNQLMPQLFFFFMCVSVCVFFPSASALFVPFFFFSCLSRSPTLSGAFGVDRERHG